MSLTATNNRKKTVAPKVYPQKTLKMRFFKENDTFLEKLWFRTWFQTSETKNQGLKGPRRNQDQDFASRDQDIKAESRDQD